MGEKSTLVDFFSIECRKNNCKPYFYAFPSEHIDREFLRPLCPGPPGTLCMSYGDGESDQMWISERNRNTNKQAY